MDENLSEPAGRPALSQVEEALLLDLKAGTQDAIADRYVELMRQEHEAGIPVSWGVVNRAIIARWSRSGLERVKRLAHKKAGLA